MPRKRTGIECPTCGAAMRCVETRNLGGGIKRRRFVCSTALCVQPNMSVTDGKPAQVAERSCVKKAPPKKKPAPPAPKIVQYGRVIPKRPDFVILDEEEERYDCLSMDELRILL